MTGGLRIGIDVGGTFTDVVAVDGARLVTAKLSSTPADPSRAVLLGLTDVLAQLGATAADVGSLAHGTTVATNAALERRGAPVGFITTAGFEDVVEIGRLQRSAIYDLATEGETPVFIAPRHRRAGVPERVGPDGAVVVPLDEAAVAAAADRLVAAGARSIAVGYLFAHLDPTHERRTGAIVAGRHPGLPVSLSSDVDPRFREYERFSTTLFDAYLKPLVTGYLHHLADDLAARGIRSFHVMRSSGGLSPAREAASQPITLLQSGLAAGVLGACATAAAVGCPDAITVDIGGTSCDVALTRAGAAGVRSDVRLGVHTIRTPTLDVSTIGAGGGSIGWLDAGGGLHVGPRSAGAEPGPACYGRGGIAPTVTDASLLLGYLGAERFAGGALRLDVDAARAALAPLSRALDLSIEDTAAGMHRILNAAMTDEISRISLHRGEDPRGFALVLLGGGGPIHGAELARELDIATLVVPRVPGLLAAYGLLTAPITHDAEMPLGCLLTPAALPRLRDACAALDARGHDALGSVAAVQFSAQLRYAGQSHELDVMLPPLVEPDVLAEVIRRFEATHARHYGRISPARAIEITGVQARHALPAPDAPALPAPRTGTVAQAQRGSRPVYDWRRRAWVETPLYDRASLPVGGVLSGPAVVEQFDTTILVPGFATAVTHETGDMLITLEPRS